jgi:hypothetical protein
MVTNGRYLPSLGILGTTGISRGWCDDDRISPR